jgi:cell division protein FtsA
VIPSQTICGIDIGTTKICTVVAAIERDGEISILGVGRVPSKGLRKGIVVDLDRTVQSIRESKQQAEQMAGVEVDSAFVGITGSHIRAHPSNAVVAVTDPSRGITSEDTIRALDLAQRVEIPQGRRLIDVRVRDYIVDGQMGIADPIGTNGMRLEVNALLITAAISHLQSINRAVNNADVDVENIILEPIASGEAVLSAEERDAGVAILDIGGGTADLAIFQDGSVAHVAILPIGGDHFDSDLAYGINITPREAEHLKIRLGGVSRECLVSDELIEITKQRGERRETIPLKIICEIIYPRAEEIFRLVRANLETAGLMGRVPAGLVLTGGTSLLEGMTDLASGVMGMQTRIGFPQFVSGLTEELRSPIYATAIGLVQLGATEYGSRRSVRDNGSVANALAVAKNWGIAFLRWVTR